MKITEGAPQTRADVFRPEVTKIVVALLCKPTETFITDETCIRDLVGHEARVDVEGLTKTLGVLIKDARETIVDVAERMRKAGK
jgi:hypothetical protein